MKILLSYPRSGNHLVRFIIEILTDNPTIGCLNNLKDDKPIYTNYTNYKDVNNNLIFNMLNEYQITTNNTYYNALNKILQNKNNYFIKFHMINNLKNYENSITNENSIANDKINTNTLIIIIRNPREVLLRQNNFKPNISNTFACYNSYFDIIDYYLNFKGNKVIFYFEDIISKKTEFIQELYKFLNINNIDKLNYLLNNIDEYYNISSNNTSKGFGGMNTNISNNDDKNINTYYYDKCPDNIKPIINNYLKKKSKNENYKFIFDKYNLQF
jgi:hypothetical protein